MQLPVGESDFREIIENHFCFVDKTLLIKEIIDDNKVILFTRPRRFGKTLNLSMLRYFFGLDVDDESIKPPLKTEHSGKRSNWLSAIRKFFGVGSNDREDRSLFDQLEISRAGSKYLKHQGRYPVISISFKNVKKNSFSTAYEGICGVIKTMYRQHLYLLESDALIESEKRTYQSILDGKAKEIDIELSLYYLTIYLHDHHHSDVVVLIDEYDTPIQSGYLHGYYDEMVEFFRSFFGAALKDNSVVFKAVLTGILRVSKENLFSGLNNLIVYSILHSRYDAYFGFTEKEVENLLKQADLEDRSDEVKRWYNGYKIGSKTIYNPWSIANYIKEKELKPYWVNTSDNALIKDLIARSNGEFRKELEGLLSGGSIRYLIDDAFVFADLNEKDPSTLWTLMFLSGYLKADSCELTRRGSQCDFSIPNLEILQVYEKIVEEWVSGKRGFKWYNAFLNHLLNGDIEAFKEDLQCIMDQVVSVHDTARDPEAFYHGLVIGLTASLHHDENYELRSNRESGKGRYDYFIVSRNPQKLSILLEFKKSENKTLKSSAKSALEQIDLKNYFSEADQRDIKKLLKIGIAFSGNDFFLAYDSSI